AVVLVEGLALDDALVAAAVAVGGVAVVAQLGAHADAVAAAGGAAAGTGAGPAVLHQLAVVRAAVAVLLVAVVADLGAAHAAVAPDDCGHAGLAGRGAGEVRLHRAQGAAAVEALRVAVVAFLARGQVALAVAAHRAPGAGHADLLADPAGLDALAVG